MSLFSGMRLTSGKKQTQSISAKVQVEDGKAGNKAGNTKQVDGQSVPLQQPCSSSPERTKDASANIEASSAQAGTIKLKEEDKDSGAKGSGSTCGARSGSSTSGTSVKDGGGSMFSFIMETPSDLESHSLQEQGADGSLVTNLDASKDPPGKSGGRSSTHDTDAIIRTTESGHKLSPSLELELDPFSVDKPSDKTQIQASKLSFDLEGLDLTPDSQSIVQDTKVLSDTSVEEKDKTTEDTKLKMGTEVLSRHDKVSNQGDDGGAAAKEFEEELETNYAPVTFEEDTKIVGESEVTTGDEGDNLSRNRRDQGDLHGQKGGDKMATSSESQYNVQLSFPDQLEVMLQMHAAKLKHFSEAFDELMSQISVATSDCIQSSANLLQKQQTLKRIQTQQSEAVAQEDYEQAESLNEQCETLEAELQKIPSHAMPSNHPAILDLVDTITKLHVEEKTCRDDQLRDLGEMREKQEAVLEEVKGQHAKTETSEMCELEEEKSALQRDLGHLNLDKEHLERKEKQLEKRIDEKTIDLRQARDQLSESRTNLQEEITELEKKLASLRDQEQQLTKDISHQEEVIAEAKEEFGDEIKAFDKERSEVNAKEAEVKIREVKVQQMEETIGSRMEKGKAEVTRGEALLDTITQAVQTLQQDMLKFDDTVTMATSDSESTVVSSREDHQKLYRLQDKLKTQSATVQALTADVLQAQTKIVSLRQKVSDTEGHIAVLTEAKQLAVSGRNFAEAKRLANEIKELTCEGQKSQSELEETIATRDKCNKELEALKEDIAEMKTEYVKEEFEYDSNLKDRLLQHVQTLQQRITNDKLNSLSRTLLEADIQSCIVLIQYLCIKHGDTLPECLQEHVVEVKLAQDDGKDAQVDSPMDTKETASSVVSSEVSEIHSKIEELESQLQTAVDQEDYDTAQLLQEQIEELQKT